MPKGQYKRQKITKPGNIISIPDLKQQLKIGNAKLRVSEHDLKDTTSAVTALQDEIRNMKERGENGLTSINIEVTRQGRTIHQAEFTIQTNEENFSAVIGKGGLVQTTVTKF